MKKKTKKAKWVQIDLEQAIAAEKANKKVKPKK
jgi:hypothetical protein